MDRRVDVDVPEYDKPRILAHLDTKGRYLVDVVSTVKGLVPLGCPSDDLTLHLRIGLEDNRYYRVRASCPNPTSRNSICGACSFNTENKRLPEF